MKCGIFRYSVLFFGLFEKVNAVHRRSLNFNFYTTILTRKKFRGYPYDF